MNLGYEKKNLTLDLASVFGTRVAASTRSMKGEDGVEVSLAVLSQLQ